MEILRLHNLAGIATLAVIIDLVIVFGLGA